MADSERTFKLYGVEYPIVAPPDFEVGELVDCENLFNTDFDSTTFDTRRFASIIYVSVRRVDPTFALAALRKLGRAEREEIHESIIAWSQEDDEPVDPPQGEAPKSDDSPTEQNSVDEPGSNAESESGDLNGSGHLSSQPSSDSARPTFIA